MHQRFYKIIVAFLLGCTSAAAQEPLYRLQVPPVRTFSVSAGTDQRPWYAINKRNFNKIQAGTQPSTAISMPPRLIGWPLNVQVTLAPNANSGSITQNYYTQHFGFFCRQELKVEKASGLPLRFRLGSVQQCDQIEGK